MAVAALAKHLGVTRRKLSRVVNGKAAVSADLAIRLAAALRSAESWLRMQLAYDLWHATSCFGSSFGARTSGRPLNLRHRAASIVAVVLIPSTRCNHVAHVLRCGLTLVRGYERIARVPNFSAFPVPGQRIRLAMLSM